MGIHSNTYKNYTKGDKDPSEDEVTATQKAQDKTISTGKICFLSEIKCTGTCTSTLKFGLQYLKNFKYLTFFHNQTFCLT